MKAVIGGGGFIFRFMIAGITAILVVSTLSLAYSVVTGGGTGTATGRFLQDGSGNFWFFLLIEIVAGIMTFAGSFVIVSSKKRHKKGKRTKRIRQPPS